jgi:hypothetical protein
MAYLEDSIRREYTASNTGLSMPKKQSKTAQKAKKTIAALTLLLASCTNTTINPPTPPINPPEPPTHPIHGQLHQCEKTTAEEYQEQHNLPFNITPYDTNTPECFTTDEKTLVQTLQDLHEKGVETETLQQIINRFTTVGPIIPHAVRRTHQEYTKEKEYDPQLTFNATTIGILDLHQMLAWSLPSRHADPEIYHPLGGKILDQPPTNYPINYQTGIVSGPDWLNTTPELLTGLKKFEGIEECNTGENILNVSSINMNLHREIDPNSPTHRELLWYEATLPTLPGALVMVSEILVELRPLPYEHNSANIGFKQHIHPYDRTLVDTPYLEFRLTHTMPDKVRYFGIDDLSLVLNQKVTPEDIQLYVNPYMPAFLLDFTVLAEPDFGKGYGNEHFTTEEPIGPARANGQRVIDIMMARHYPEGIRALPIQPRYSQNNMIYAPCTIFAPLPDKR